MMNLKINENQKKVLETLLNKYEGSKTYKKENARNQRFSIKPEKIFPEYYSDFSDVDDVAQFNREMSFLEDNELIFLTIKNAEIIEITVNIKKIPSIYELLNRKDITTMRNAQIEMYKKYMGIHQIIDEFCKVQIERLSNFKDAEYDIKISENIIKLLKNILTNKKDIMERELSLAVLGDTKLFKNYINCICKIIEKYGSLEIDLAGFDKNEKEKVILEEFHILSNPSYVFFKGYVEINYNDGGAVNVKPDRAIAVSSETIEQIAEVKVNEDVNKIITVENLTSYNRVKDKQAAFIFLSGYHNTAKQKFLMKIAETNKNVKWYHFGDIDPDGYYILKNLIEKTGISFKPLDMGIEQLKSFKQYCKKLEKNDITKALSLKEIGFYKDIMHYMLENNCKLEQEIISWRKEQY